MVKLNTSAEDTFFFSVPQARWVVCVLDLVIAVVGRGSLLGLILLQTRSEIVSIVRDEEPAIAPTPVGFENN